MHYLPVLEDNSVVRVVDVFVCPKFRNFVQCIQFRNCLEKIPAIEPEKLKYEEIRLD